MTAATVWRAMTCMHAYRRRVEFADTDMAGVVHFASLFRYVEEAEHDLYRSVGGSAFESGEDRVRGLPRVHASLDFRAPAFYGDLVEIRLSVAEKAESRLNYDVRIERPATDGRDPATIATGRMVVVSVEAPHGRRGWDVAPLPTPLAAALEAAKTQEGPDRG